MKKKTNKKIKISIEQMPNIEEFDGVFNYDKIAWSKVAIVNNDTKYTVCALGVKQDVKTFDYECQPTIFVRDFQNKVQADMYHDGITEIMRYQACSCAQIMGEITDKIDRIKAFNDFVRNQNTKKFIR